MWDLSCVDWADRLRDGRSLVPDLPLIEEEASMGLQFYDELRLPDVPGNPKLRTASGQWFRDIVRASFGSWDPVNQVRHIRDIIAMAPKGSSKTSYSAGLMLSVMLMNRRPRAEALFVGPTQAISDRAYDQAAGMIEEDRDLQKRFATHDHVKTIECRVTRSEMKVKTFDLRILTGAILIFVLLDELHLLGKSPHTTKVLRQIRGGLDKTPEGQLLITTTQSDDIPAGAFKQRAARGAPDPRRGLPRQDHAADAAGALRVSEGDRRGAARPQDTAALARSGALADGAAEPRQVGVPRQPGRGLEHREGQGRRRHQGVGVAAPQHRDRHRHLERRLARRRLLGSRRRRDADAARRCCSAPKWSRSASTAAASTTCSASR
jgi:hypothetical protein